MSIKIVKGTANSLIDGVTVKHLGEDICYFLGDVLLLQVGLTEDFDREVIIKQEVLLPEEKKILDRLLIRLGLDTHVKQSIVLDGGNYIVT